MNGMAWVFSFFPLSLQIGKRYVVTLTWSDQCLKTQSEILSLLKSVSKSLLISVEL